MAILITGATGLVGQALIENLMFSGHEDIHVLSRSPKKAEDSIPFPIKAFHWDPSKEIIDEEAFKGVQTVVHLAGENLTAKRWSQAQKDKILNSRAKGSQLLLSAIKKLHQKPSRFISASAVGIYGSRGDELITTDSSLGTDFLAQVCKTWEAITLNHKVDNLDALCLRIGVVLSTQGGALAKMVPGFKTGFAGPLGSGKQYLSWIHIDDLVELIKFCIENPVKHSVLNAVAPEPVTNKAFTKILAKALGTTAIIPVPGIALKGVLGEMATVLLEGQKVEPNHLENIGFQFKYKSLKQALDHLLRFEQKGESQLVRYQFISKSIDDVFEFFSHEKNLEQITPPHLNFKVENKSTENIEKGTVINYKLKLHGIPMKWSSLILEYKPGEMFIDKQIKGPYDKWVHTHSFFPLKRGTLIKDEVHYKLPLGFLGRWFGGPFVRKDVNTIFNYRQKVIKDIF